MTKQIRITLTLLLGVIIFSSFNRAEDSQKAYIDKAYFSKLVFDEVNKVRVSNGKSKLKWNSTCAKTAWEQARYCASIGKLTHKQTDPEKENVKKRYQYYKGEAHTVGENLLSLVFRIPNYHEGDSITDRIARRYESAAKFMVRLWMQSPPHKKNLLYADYRQAGIGMVYTNKNEVFVGQVFID